MPTLSYIIEILQNSRAAIGHVPRLAARQSYHVLTELSVYLVVTRIAATMEINIRLLGAVDLFY